AAGTPVAEICRKLEVTETTFYRWRKKYGGLGVSELRELKQLKEENRKLEQLVADLSLDKSILQEALRKNGDAHAGAGGGGVGKRFVPSEREEGVPGGRGEPLERTVPQRAPESGCTARSAEGVGRGAGELGLQAAPRAAAARGLACQSQAGLP